MDMDIGTDRTDMTYIRYTVEYWVQVIIPDRIGQERRKRKRQASINQDKAEGRGRG